MTPFIIFRPHHILFILSALFNANTGFAQLPNELDPTKFSALPRNAKKSPERPLNSQLIEDLYKLNAANHVLQAWTLLSHQGDGYATSAAKIFGNEINVGRCVVEENWKVVVGEEVKAKYYKLYAKLYQRAYLEFLETNWRYPNSLEIERLYQFTDDALGLPQAISVDLLFNSIPTDWEVRVFFDRLSSAVGVGRLVLDKRWYHYTELSSSRVVPDFITAENLTIPHAKEIFKKTAAGVAKCMLRKLSPKSPSQQLSPSELDGALAE